MRMSCPLVKVEVRRAVRREDESRLRFVPALLSELLLVELEDPILDDAAQLSPRQLRTLDAIHVAAARSLGDELEALVTYDHRMATAADLLGVPVASPG